MLAKRSFLMSMSHFMTETYPVSWMPEDSIPRKEGWKRASGARKRSLPMVITWPSGSSYDLSTDEEAAAVFISDSKSRAMKQSFSLMSRPARSRRMIACGRAKPSYTGTTWVTPSPIS